MDATNLAVYIGSIRKGAGLLDTTGLHYRAPFSSSRPANIVVDVVVVAAIIIIIAVVFRQTPRPVPVSMELSTGNWPGWGRGRPLGS